jgi:uncharacterized protein (TIGR04255 family)
VNLAEAKTIVGQTSPQFDAPPVVETALGVRFLPIEGLSLSVAAGQLFRKYQAHFDKLELKPIIGSDLEIHVGPRAGMLNLPIRCWFINSDGSQLVQIQNDLFIRNWRATGEQCKYQHYDSIRPLFQRDWGVFKAFLAEQGMKMPSMWQCEVTYINHLIRGRDWQDFRDIPRLFPIWRGVDATGMFSAMEVASFSAGFKLPDDSGRIQFALQPGVRRDGREILQLTVTALGKPASDSDVAIYEWLDYGHLAVVNGFLQFTSEEAHKIWRKK